ncbi:hypothetical protein CRUP_024769, partial [Coryphaenoides rupestris]
VVLHVLFEHAAGYALFAVKEVEEIGMLLPQVEASVLNIGKFNSMVSLAAFFPFKSAQAALENINAISEGVVHADLRLFLETNMPDSKKKAMWGGCAMHFHSLVKGLTAQAASKAQLGLGHSYSRAKVKFNVNRADNMIIQSIALLDQLDKDINTFSMRVRSCRRRVWKSLEEVVMDSAKAQAILDASRSSMGKTDALPINEPVWTYPPIDLINIERFSAPCGCPWADYRRGCQEYLRSRMSQVAPNLAALIGESGGSSSDFTCRKPDQSGQVPGLNGADPGAEKALFRYWGTPSLLGKGVAAVMAGLGRSREGALKTRGNTPKYGLIFHSTFIGPRCCQEQGSHLQIRWPTSRFLRVCLGTSLRNQVEERLSFYETGDLPRKNVDVMKEAVKEAIDVTTEIKRKLEKKEKKRKKHEIKIKGRKTTQQTAQFR